MHRAKTAQIGDLEQVLHDQCETAGAYTTPVHCHFGVPCAVVRQPPKGVVAVARGGIGVGLAKEGTDGIAESDVQADVRPGHMGMGRANLCSVPVEYWLLYFKGN